MKKPIKWAWAVLTALSAFQVPDGTELSAVMPRSFTTLNHEELGALCVFLPSLPTVATGVR
jgi:hypothetical protein